MELIEYRVRELVSTLESFLDECKQDLLQVSEILSEAFLGNSKILICGNGGSAADSQHFAAEFVSGFSKNIQRKGLPAISLSVDTSIITAYSNDFSYEGVFARQVEAYGDTGDVLIVITTSGISKNCIAAVIQAKNMGLKTIAFTSKGGKIIDIVDISVKVPSTNTQHIQECHMVAYHIITEIVEEKLFKKKQ